MRELSEFETLIRKLSTDCNKTYGHSHELFVEKFSEAVDSEAVAIGEPMKSVFIKMAEHYGYKKVINKENGTQQT